MYTGYLHNIDPFAFHITDTFGIRWYGVSYLIGFAVVFLIIYWLAKRGLSQLKPEQAGDFVFAVALGTILGGRLGYCIFYSPELFLTFTSSFPFWGVFAIHQGGMASHGGVIGIILGCLYYARKHHISVLHCMDLCGLCCGPGIFFGRIANFINGELVGREAPAWLAWGVRFPQDILSWPFQDPSRLGSLAPVAEKLGVAQDKWLYAVDSFQISAASRSFVNTMLAEIIGAAQRSNLAVMDALAPVLTLRHPSQIYEALLEGLFVFIVLSLIWMRPRKPGIIAGFYFVIYSAVRIFAEQFRMPDAQIGYQLFGLTRGQWLSIVMIILGSACLVYWSRRPVEKIGGWLSCRKGSA